MADRDADYVHGYSEREGQRLCDQAATLSELLHHDTRFPAGARVLEVGCGIGAQTTIIASANPEARIISTDIVVASLAQARPRVRSRGSDRVRFVNADVRRLPFADACFDHVLVCFVLEHLAQPQAALECLRRVLKPGGTLSVIEGDHGSCYFHPWSEAAWRTIACLCEAQARGGGDAMIGRRLFPLISAAGFRDVRVTPRVVYADASRPEWVQGFTRRTFIAMVEGARERVLALDLIDRCTWDAGIAALKRTAEDQGTFNYSFFKAVAIR